MPAPIYVDEREFRERLEEVSKTALDPVAGLFGPTSVTWRLLRESLGFLGAGRAVLLQLAHPWVANAIDQHSRTKTDPIGRFHRTFVPVFTILFGSLDQVHRVSTNLFALHGGIRGRLAEDSGAFPKHSKYRANEISALLWVHATLWETSVTMHEAVLGPLPHETKEAFYQEIKRFAFCFGIPESAQPTTWRDFLAYNREMWDSPELAVRETGKEVAGYLFDFDVFPGSRAILHAFRVVTAETMPPRLREEFGLPRSSIATRATYEATLRTMRAAYDRLPDRVRYIPSYFEAMDRVAGRPHADTVTKAMNRAFLGRSEVVSLHV